MLNRYTSQVIIALQIHLFIDDLLTSPYEIFYWFCVANWLNIATQTIFEFLVYLSTVKSLGEFKSNTYSQTGEDGLIAEILDRISTSYDTDQWCCEFGAWDGLYLSNTARLIREESYSAVLIEGDKKRLKELQFNFPQDHVVKVCSFVTPEGSTSLDSILEDSEIPINFDFLSIDIDGMDYYILQSLKKFRPKLICIEFNPSIPNSIFFVQENNLQIKQGSSAKAIWDLATSKNYTVIAATDINLFLLENTYLNLFLPDLKPIEVLVPHGNDPQIIFSGYDGTLLSNKPYINLSWHGVFPLTKSQVLPGWLRKFPGDYNSIQWRIFRVFFWLKRGRLTEIINSDHKVSKIQKRLRALFP